MELKHLLTLRDIARGGLQLGMNQLSDAQIADVGAALKSLSEEIAKMQTAPSDKKDEV